MSSTWLAGMDARRACQGWQRAVDVFGWAGALSFELLGAAQAAGLADVSTLACGTAANPAAGAEPGNETRGGLGGR
jgi:hypothetical protein